MQKNVSFIFPSYIPTNFHYFVFLFSSSHRFHKKTAFSSIQHRLFVMLCPIKNCYLSVTIVLYFSHSSLLQKKNTCISTGVSDCRQSNFEVAEGLGKQIRFPNRIRSRNSLPARKTASFEAFKLMELVCLFFCLSKSKS